MRIEVERTLDDLSVVTKTKIDAVVENRLIKCTNTLQSQIVKTVGFTFDDALQASYFESNNGFKSAMFNVVNQVLGEVVRSRRAPILYKTEMHSLV